MVKLHLRSGHVSTLRNCIGVDRCPTSVIEMQALGNHPTGVGGLDALDY